MRVSDGLRHFDADVSICRSHFRTELHRQIPAGKKDHYAPVRSVTPGLVGCGSVRLDFHPLEPPRSLLGCHDERSSAATTTTQQLLLLCVDSIFCSLFDVDGSSLAVTLHIVLVRIEGVLAIFVGYL